MGPSGPSVSVIIPTFNRGRFIGGAVRSVLAQTYGDLEVVVVDDGSTDDTRAVIESIADPRLRYIHQGNQGRSHARNVALGVARGRYITFLDSDDLYLPGKVEIQVRYLEAHPGTGMVYTSAYCIDGEGNRLDHVYEATVSGKIYEDIAFFTPVTITLPTVMARREVFETVGGFDERMHRFEDTDMWRRIAKSYVIDAMPEPTCLLRTHDDNALLAQDPASIVSALEYYAGKIMREDREVGWVLRRRGLAGLYAYYGHALSSVPQWQGIGRDLLRTSARYWPADLLRGWHVSRARLEAASRALYYRSLYGAYGVYSGLKKRARHLLGVGGKGEG